MGRGRKNVFKREEVQQKKYKDLTDFCSGEVLDLVRKAARRGDVIVLRCNGDYTPIEDFFKALWNEMKIPASNGASIYDCGVVFRKAYEREVTVITLNDNGNEDIVERIQTLGATRHKTLYSNLWEDK